MNEPIQGDNTEHQFDELSRAVERLRRSSSNIREASTPKVPPTFVLFMVNFECASVTGISFHAEPSGTKTHSRFVHGTQLQGLGKDDEPHRAASSSDVSHTADVSHLCLLVELIPAVALARAVLQPPRTGGLQKPLCLPSNQLPPACRRRCRPSTAACLHV